MSFIGNEDTTKKVASLIRRLSSDHDGEVIATVRALVRTLESAGSDIHALADHVEKPNGKLSNAEMQKLCDAGFAAGVETTENRYHGVHDFLNADGRPNWDTVALFLQRNKNKLDARHHQFIDDMAARTVWGREPTEKQYKYLHSLFFKLGGKIT